jgi:hypothetical protein
VIADGDEDDEPPALIGRGVLNRHERPPVDLDALTPTRLPRPGDLDVDDARRRALTVVCPVLRCRARVGQPCVNLDTGEPLGRAPAHVQRVAAAGVELLPLTTTERAGWPPRRTAAARRQLVAEEMRRLGRWI